MIRVFLVDDHHLFRTGVKSELMEKVQVIGDASEVEPAIEMIGERLPDVVLVDVHMPDGGGARVIKEVLLAHPSVRFLALSVSDAPDDVIAIIRAGARGYVTKTIGGDELSTRFGVFTRATPCSRPAWPASSSTHSPSTEQ